MQQSLNTSYGFITFKDVAYDCPLHTLLSFCEAYDAVIISFMANGPAGGNPLIEFGFRSHDSLVRFEEAYASLTELQVMALVTSPIR